MIGIEEVTQYAARFGAPQSQIIRDHLISHVLLAIGTDPQTSRYVTFFGGTGLCRTWLPELRLSEDIDLLVDSKEAGAEITKQVSRHLRRQFPNHQWAQLGSAHDVDTWSLSSGDSAVKIQFVSWRREWKLIPTTIFGVQLRYSDLPDTVELIVPTASGFATMKLLAWFDRAAPRDLFDLAAQAQAGHIDVPAIQLVQKDCRAPTNIYLFGKACAEIS